MATIIGTNNSDPLSLLIGGVGPDVIIGLGGNDRISGDPGADYLFGGTGNDNFVYLFGDETSDNQGSFDHIDGGLGDDTLEVTIQADFRNTTIVSIEALKFTDNSMDTLREASFNSSQFGGTGIDVNFRISGAVNEDALVVTLDGGAVFDMRGFSFTNWDSGASALLGDQVRVSGSAVAEKVIGTAVNDYMEGVGGADRLYGGAGLDLLDGGEGGDVLYGGLGNDYHATGNGADIIVFDSAFNSATNVDTISDFSVPLDTIWLKKAIFTGLGAIGTLTADQFKTIGVPGASVDASDRVIYDRGTGFLYYDVNGSVAGGAAKIAELPTGLIMTNADFYVFA
jgi:Ca2+-binding RTX toxin-like protein